jgi:hypothetical protein
MALIFVVALGAAVAVQFLAAQADRRSRDESYQRDNYTTIEEGLRLGGILSEPPPGTLAVLNVCETEDPHRVEFHRWQPISDHGPAPGFEWLRAQVDFIDQHRKAGRPVYVHCRAGVNRGVMVTAAYLMWRDGLTRDQALELIRSKRPRAGPFPVYREFLLEWEKALK